MEEEIDNKIEEISLKIKQKEREVYFSGEYDKGSAIISIFSGAGGLEAQDWVAMLLRMYQRYAEEKGFKAKILDQSFGEGVGPDGRIGIKSVIFEVKGRFAYGQLRNEQGVHRLVRQSPFSSQSLRHTSFALVEVMPEIKESKDIEINPDELRVDYYKASGPGGQYVNKRMTAVRITHLPTNTVAACQSERSQAQNKEKAMSLLTSRLYQLKLEQKKEKLSEVKGERVSPSWGNQIRSYVLHPYRLIKDLRTDIESTNPDAVLDGELNEFIEAEIKI